MLKLSRSSGRPNSNGRRRSAHEDTDRSGNEGDRPDAIEDIGIPGVVLMENAGLRIVRALKGRVPEARG